MNRPDPFQVALFMLASRPEVFGRWPIKLLTTWIQDRQQRDMLAVVTDGGDIVGMAVAWRAHKSDLDDPWCRWDDTGTCLYLSQVHATKPHALAALVEMLRRRCPDYAKLCLFATRRGKLKRLPKTYIDRLRKQTYRRIKD